jgi:flagellar protein FliO/FliZ
MNGAWQATASMLLVLAAIVAAAWLLRRAMRPSSGQASLLRVLAAVSVGPRERVVIVQAGSQWLVLGVAAGRVSALQTLPRGEAPAPEAAPGGFAEILRRLGARDG